MAPKANWKGFLKLSLVSRSIALFPATSTRERIRFNIINRETGNRVRYRQIDAESGEDVPEEDRVKGYKVADGSFLLVEPDELEIDIDDVKVPKDMLELAEHILKSKRAHFDPSKYSNRYEDALKALIQAKQAGRAPPAAPERPSNVINLVDALRRSVRSERGSGKSTDKTPARRGKRRAERFTPAQRTHAAKPKRLKRAS